MVVEDTTQPLKRNHKHKFRGTGNKILLGDFAYPPLALFAKRCCRMATCVVDMFPENAFFAWDTFTDQFQQVVDEGRGKEMIEALKVVVDDGDKKDELIRFVRFFFRTLSLLLCLPLDELWFCCYLL